MRRTATGRNFYLAQRVASQCFVRFCEAKLLRAKIGRSFCGTHFKHRYYFFSCFEPCLLCFEPLSVSFASPFVCHATRYSLGRATLLACVLPHVLAASFWRVHQPFVANAQSGSLISAYANDNLATVAPLLMLASVSVLVGLRSWSTGVYK